MTLPLSCVNNKHIFMALKDQHHPPSAAPAEDSKAGGRTPAASLLILAVIIAISLVSCTPNNPYRTSEEGSNTFYSTFNEPPKHLDPARAYSSDEYAFIGQIYEPPLEYHYLDRPYRLIPLTVEEVPVPRYFGPGGEELTEDAPPAEVARAVYEMTVAEGLMFQPHPAFAASPEGRPLYMALTEADMADIDSLEEFPKTGARAVTSDDFIYQIQRLADPRVESPILSILEKYIDGLAEFSAALRAELKETREARKLKAGAAYNQVLDEKTDPIVLDYSAHPLAGIERVDGRTFRVVLKTKYPQFIYWLAMPFFSPMPEEAIRFYGQAPLSERNITLDRYPVGTGPYRIETYKPNMEIILRKNENFRDARYPASGEAGDLEAGLLIDAGRPLPITGRLVFKLEKEAIPRWNKFLQGYYDNSGISSESFDQAVTISAGGEAELTPFMTDKGIRLITSVRPSSYYAGFNMLDETVGGYTDKQKKLRQAISIALDYEEYIEIFNNGRGIPAMGPLPPGIFGHIEGRDGINRYVYDWDEKHGRAVRKSIEYAKKLMIEAGYPGGRDAEGRPLVITLDNPWTGAEFTPMINWYIKKFRLLGIQLENRTTDYNRFREKMLGGNFQFFAWGWNADYPDPENFFFLLAGSNSKVATQGENVANYASPVFDAAFRRMENMNNTPERLEIIRDMTRTLQEDSPWVWGFHPVAFGLYHQWVDNVKSNAMANNTMKYIKIDAEARTGFRHAWNRPRLWPVALLIIVLVAASVPAMISLRRRRGE